MNKYLLWCLFAINVLFLCSCNTQENQEIIFNGVFPKDNTVLLILYEGMYEETNFFSQNIAGDSSRQTVSICVPMKELLKSTRVDVAFANDVELYHINLSGKVALSAAEFRDIIYWKNNVSISNPTTKNSFHLHVEDMNFNAVFAILSDDFLKQQHHPIDLQLFLRLSFCVVLLFLIAFLYRQSSTQRILLVPVAFFIATLPLRIGYSTWSMVFMAFTMIIAFIRNKPRTFNWQPVFYVLCSLYAMNVAGLLYTGDWERGLARLDSTVPLVAFPLVFSMIQFSKKNIMLLLRFFVWSVMAFCTFGLLSYAAIVPELTWDMVFADSKFYAPLLTMWPAHWHPSFDSTIIMMAAPIAIYLRYQDGKQISFVEMLPGVVLPVVFTVLTGARVGMIAAPALLGLAYVFYCKFKPIFKWGLAVAGLAVAGILLHQFPKAADQFVDSVRSDLRKTAISAIKEEPVFGWGTGNVAKIIQSEERAHRLGLDAPVPLVQFHNQYLEDMVQFGIPGILVLLWLFGWLLWLGVRRRDCLLLSLLIIYALFFWTESALANAKGIVPFTFWVCFLVATQKNRLGKGMPFCRETVCRAQ